MHESRTDFIKRRADEMRAEMTKAERRLRRLLNSQWRSQEPILGSYIADFFHPIYRIVIEADGGYHNTVLQVAKDALRDSRMAADGIVVLRFTNLQILKQTPWVSACIDRQVATTCKAKGIPPTGRHSTKQRLTVDQRNNARQKRLNGGKRQFHVIPERDPLDDL